MKLLLLFTLALIASNNYSQSTIRGNVYIKKNEPVAGANIYIKGTFEGTTTGADGNFSLTTNLTGRQVLVVSFVGFKQIEEPVNLAEKIISFSFQLHENEEQIGEVVITAGTFEAGDEATSGSMNTLDMLTSGGSLGDLYGALNSLPGTSVNDDEGGLMVRGGEQYETKTFIDGLLVESPYSAKLPSIPVRGRFSPILFRGTVFSTGGYSAEYGQALSSAMILNSITHPKKNLTDICINSAALYASKTQRWENTSFSSTTQYSNMAPYFKFTNSNIKWDKEPVNFNQTLTFRQKIGEKGMLKTMGNLAYDNSGLRYYNIDTKVNDMVSMKNINSFFITSYATELKNNWIFYSGVSLSGDDSGLGYNGNMLNNKCRSGEFKSTLNKPLNKKIDLKFGPEIYIKDYKRVYFDNSQVFNPDWHFTNITSAGFVESEIKVSTRISTRVGARFEALSLSNEAYISPRLCIAYKLTSKTQVSASYGQFSQQPDDESLIYSNQLGSEKAQHFILNYQYMSNGRTFRIEAYHKNYDNLVKYDSLYSIFPESYNNNGNGFAQGIDVFYRDNKTIRNGEFWVSYSLMDSKRNYRDYNFAQTPYFISTHNLSLVYKHYFQKIDSYLSMDYKFASGRPYLNPNINGNNQLYTIPYNNINLSLFHFAEVFGRFTMLFVQVNNIPGFKQVFGYRFSKNPDSEGHFDSVEVGPMSKRFFIAGIYISLNDKPEF